MAITQQGTSDAMTVKAYAEKVFREVQKESIFANRFMGSDMNSAVYVKTELEKGKGDQVSFALVDRLTGSGQTNSTLEGNEEELTHSSDSVTLNQYRHACLVETGISEQRVAFSFPSEARDRIKVWGSEKIDQLCVDALVASPTHVGYRDNGASGAVTFTTTPATAQGALSVANSKINTSLLAATKTAATTGFDRLINPISPVKYNGGQYYIALMHPDVLHDIRADSTFSAALQDAMPRGKDNPLFRDAEFCWQNVIFHANEKMPIGTDGGGGSVPWAKCVLFGAQALVWAWGRKPKYVEKTRDYDNQLGVAFDMIAGVTKPQFDIRGQGTSDHGSIAFYVARTQISDSI